MIKEGTCDEHQVMYRSVESLHCTPEINISLHVHLLGFIFFNVDVFIYFEREHGGGSEREGGRDSQASSALSAQSPTRGSVSRSMRS